MELDFDADGNVLGGVRPPTLDVPAGVYKTRLVPFAPCFLLGGYEPGSTIKPFVGLAGLELGIVNDEDEVFSGGEFYLPNVSRPYRDWKRGGHGSVNIYEALEQSVNSYFYQLALDLGIDRMHDYLGQFGFGEPTGLDLLGEKSGVLPSRGATRIAVPVASAKTLSSYTTPAVHRRASPSTSPRDQPPNR